LLLTIRFWEFYVKLKEKDPKLTAELKSVLVPMLLYFFQDLSTSDSQKVATRLYVTFAKRFFTEDRSPETFTALSNIARIITSNTFDVGLGLQISQQVY